MDGKGVKRKKKSFRQKIMKFHKKGVNGRGVKVDDESFEYFLHVLKIMNQDFESDEEKRDFVHNVFEQLRSHKVEYSCNQVISRIVDTLLPLASDEVILNFMNAFDSQLRITCMDPFASHVLEKLIVTGLERYQTRSKEKSNESEDESSSEKYCEWLLKVAKYSLNNFEEFIFDNYANHVLRTVLCCVVGETENSLTKSVSNDQKIVPVEFSRILKDFVDLLTKWPRLKELPFNNLSSGFLQMLIRSIARVNLKRTKLLIRWLLDNCFAPESENTESDEKKMQDSTSCPSVFESDACVRLLEVVISVAPPKLFTQIYARCFINRLPVIACLPTGNFAVQKLIQHCLEKSFESIFDELASSIETIMSNKRTGVILQLCEACVRHKTKQSVFMQVWMEYLGCNEPKESQILLCHLTVYMKRRTDFNADEQNSVTLHGSLLVQHMLKFNKPIKIISSILEMNGSQLANLFCDPSGSHIANAFFDSEYVGEKSREKLFKVLQNSYASLAISKHGSRVFDILWNAANVKNRTSIATELLEEEAKLSASPFGRPVIFKLSLSTFRRHREEWIKAQTAPQKAKKLFADFLSNS